MKPNQTVKHHKRRRSFYRDFPVFDDKLHAVGRESFRESFLVESYIFDGASEFAYPFVLVIVLVLARQCLCCMHTSLWMKISLVFQYHKISDS